MSSLFICPPMAIQKHPYCAMSWPNSCSVMCQRRVTCDGMCLCLMLHQLIHNGEAQKRGTVWEQSFMQMTKTWKAGEATSTKNFLWQAWMCFVLSNVDFFWSSLEASAVAEELSQSLHHGQLRAKGDNRWGESTDKPTKVHHGPTKYGKSVLTRD